MLIKTNIGIILSAGLLLSSLGGCSGNDSSPTDADLGQQIGMALIAACPMAAPSDEQARAQCSAQLTDNKFLAGVMSEPFLWGGQTPGTSYHPEESGMNRFNVLVWRRMYLSLLMFPGGMNIESTSDGLTVVHLPFTFRNQLDMGSYPYPFWHSQKKWDSYQRATELLLIIQNGKWFGAMRGADQDMTRVEVSHTWSGQWHWEVGSQTEPYVTLYEYLFSPQNPNIARLDTAYRNLNDGLRQNACLMCHSPDNYAAATQLEFFNYPNQALNSRNNIIANLQANTMPPVNNTLGLPAGIADESARQELLALAQEFKAAGDAALEYEGELKPANIVIAPK